MEKRYVIETELPDGWHWFAGIADYPYKDKNGHAQKMPMNAWTTYRDEVLEFDDKEKCEEFNRKVLPDTSAKVVSVEEANFKYCYEKIDNGMFLGAKRQCNLAKGDCFKVEKSAGYWFKVLEITDEGTKANCQKYSTKNGQRDGWLKDGQEKFSIVSQKYVYIIYNMRENARISNE